MREQIFFSIWSAGWGAWVLALVLLSRQLARRGEQEAWSAEVCYACGYERLRLKATDPCPECGRVPLRDRAVRGRRMEASRGTAMLLAVFFSVMLGAWAAVWSASRAVDGVLGATCSSPAFFIVGFAVHALAGWRGPRAFAWIVTGAMMPALLVMASTIFNAFAAASYDPPFMKVAFVWLIGLPMSGYGLLLGALCARASDVRQHPR